MQVTRWMRAATGMRRLSIVCLGLVLAVTARADWPLGGLAVEGTVGGPLGFAQAVSDQVGGVLVQHGPWNTAVRVDATGNQRWSVPTSEPFRGVVPVNVVPDGAGGAWSVVNRGSDSRLVAQHWSASGTAIGPSVVIGNFPDERFHLLSASDSSGGFHAVWSELRIPTDYRFDVYAAHVSAAGAVTGSARGMLLFSGGESVVPSALVVTASGTLLALAARTLPAPETSLQLVVRAFDGALAPVGDELAWQPASSISSPAMVSDGGDGAWVAWTRSVLNASEIRVLRIGTGGVVAPGWSLEGVRPGEPLVQHHPSIAPDGAGGVFAAWAVSDTIQQVAHGRVLRVNPDGTPAPGWPAAGVELEPKHLLSMGPTSVVADGAGGCYLAWVRSGVGPSTIIATHLDEAGAPAPGWPSDGIDLARPTMPVKTPTVMTDGAGGAYVMWPHFAYPVSAHEGIFETRLQRLLPGGVADTPVPAPAGLALARVWPNPATRAFRVSFAVPDDRPATLELFGVDGRRYATSVQSGAGTHDVRFDLGERPNAGLYWLRLTHASGSATAKVAIIR